MKNELKYFTNSSVPMNAVTMPVATFTTDAMDVTNYTGAFLIQVVRTLSDGTATFIVEASNDNTVWGKYIPIIDSGGRGETSKTQDYYPKAVASTIAISTTKEAHAQDQICLPRYLRLAFTISGSPTGNISASILLNK